MKSVFGILFLAQHTATDAQHHRAVAPNEHLERRFISLGDETLEKMGIGQTAVLRANDSAEVLEERA